MGHFLSPNLLPILILVPLLSPRLLSLRLLSLRLLSPRLLSPRSLLSHPPRRNLSYPKAPVNTRPTITSFAAPPETPRPAPAGRTGSMPKQVGFVFAVLGTLGSQAVLITALLYYLGWVRAQATLDYFGLDTALVGYSTPDYVLRSLNSAFPPLIVIALISLALLTVHRTVILPAVRQAGQRIDQLLTVGVVTGAALGAAVCANLLMPDLIGGLAGPALPLSLLGSVGIIAYCGYLRSLPTAEDILSSPSARFQAAVLLTLGLLALLWTLALYAQQVGERRAADIAAHLGAAPEIVVYSAERLMITGSGVVIDEIGQDGTKYRYRYSGLRLMAHAQGNYILLPMGWRKGEESAYVLPADASVRIDVTAR